MLISTIAGFRQESAPKSMFKRNVDLVVEGAGGVAIRIHSTYNEADLDEIQRAIATLRWN